LMLVTAVVPHWKVACSGVGNSLLRQSVRWRRNDRSKPCAAVAGRGPGSLTGGKTRPIAPPDVAFRQRQTAKRQHGNACGGLPHAAQYASDAMLLRVHAFHAPSETL
jgi:hypothetical protein